MRKPVFVSAKTKAQISCAVIVQQISAFHLLSKSEISSLFYGCTDRLMMDLVRNPEDRYSLNVAYILDIFHNESDI